MNNYDIFAQFYDLIMGDRVKDSTLIEELMRQYNLSTNTILELGCGTGTFLKYFLDHGYLVAGIDLSEKMLDIARTKLPNTELLRQDMRSFLLPNKYDSILCLFDSINHLLNYPDWESVFSRAKSHLNNNGLFIFDINTRKKLETLAQSDPIINDYNNGTKMIIKISLRENEIYDWNVRIIEKINGEEKNNVENIQERSFPIIRIQNSLRKIFNEVYILDRNKNIGSEDSGRVYFVCKNTNID